MFTMIGATLGALPEARAAGLSRPVGRRAPEPVRGGSRLAGRCEGGWWRPVRRREARRIVLAARRYELAGRERGRRSGPLGHVALEVLDLLANLVDHRTGRLDPSLATLMGRLKRSRDAVVRALAALRAHGFLDWLRRCAPTGLAEGPGPRMRQVSNAYRLSLPARAGRLLGWRAEAPPLPDDVAQAQAEHAAEAAAHRMSLPLPALARHEVEDDALARALADLGHAVAERESARQGGSRFREIPQA